MSAIPTTRMNLYVLVAHGLYALKHKSKSKVWLRLKIMGFLFCFCFNVVLVCLFFQCCCHVCFVFLSFDGNETLMNIKD